ncbi:MAG: glycine cleavage system protein GcvH [Candidatus Omnitrophica bacterium]|nr:glycine cleavage system protein GcvH [Candidatus Omnitrophota bacterium]MBU1127477.1 glycine cleavage system protein GcvH [Candidatus Omnitrophota bacterium]MBU1785049.1 glycine cleavage system protein GcvH [Candidatus Omnitrophota bacterium]MBU1851885.1 glycine cleavage system protein GcvH [Candidatus Omnitrophota bacterium]
MVPEELKYTKEHEWVKIDGETALIGITDHAQSELGDITFIELPVQAKQVKRGESVATVESVKAASDVYSPISGEIVEVNGLLEDAPETINLSPYENGWIFQIKISDGGEVETMMDAAAYEEYLGTL